LIWFSLPYKKDKSQKPTEIQPVTEESTEVETEPVSEAKPEPVPQPEIKPAVQPANNSDIEQLRNSTQLLKEYKTLLDDGLISQEDYEKKKNELLGL
jgi:hypothetical protein